VDTARRRYGWRSRTAWLLRWAAAHLDDQRTPPRLAMTPELVDLEARHRARLAAEAAVPGGHAQGRADLQLTHGGRWRAPWRAPWGRRGGQ
jgi:hypothetical protein